MGNNSEYMRKKKELRIYEKKKKTKNYENKLDSGRPVFLIEGLSTQLTMFLRASLLYGPRQDPRTTQRVRHRIHLDFG